jgi:hypothetical protein
VVTAKRTLPVVGTVVAALLAAGCYGSTQPATERGPSSVRLNATGTANNGPAYSFFEYNKVITPGTVLTTPRRTWPAGATGSFGEVVSGLSGATTYSFRLCGGDQGSAPSCAQYRQFQTTGPAGKDSVQGGWITGHGAGAPSGFVNAVSGPSGENLTGSLQFYGYDDAGIFYRFDGFVTCLAIDGNRAAIGAVGRAERQDNTNTAATGLVTVIDDDLDREGNDDRVTWKLAPGSTPPSCAGAPPATGSVLLSLLVVTDTRP